MCKWGLSDWNNQDTEPSDVDVSAHKQLTETGKILGLRILDHIIVIKKEYFRFQEEG